MFDHNKSWLDYVSGFQIASILCLIIAKADQIIFQHFKCEQIKTALLLDLFTSKYQDLLKSGPKELQKPL